MISQLTLETSPNDCELPGNGNFQLDGRISVRKKSQCAVELSQCYSVSGGLFDCRSSLSLLLLVSICILLNAHVK